MKSVLRRNFNFEEFVGRAARREKMCIEGFEEKQSDKDGMFIPVEMIFSRDLKNIRTTRDLTSAVSALGGALMQQDVDDNIIRPLRTANLASLGIEVRILGHDRILPYVPNASDIPSYWLADNQTIPESDFGTAGLLLSAHRLVSMINFSKLVAAQAQNFEANMRALIGEKLLNDLLTAALTGIGGVQPIGLLNTKNVNTTAFGGPATWASILEFERILGDANATQGASLGWATSPLTRKKLKSVQRATGTSTFLMNDDGTMAGAPSVATTALNTANAGDKVIFGNWEDLVVAILGGGLWIQMNPFTLAKTGENVLNVTQYCDVGVKRPASFVYSTDSAVQ